MPFNLELNENDEVEYLGKIWKVYRVSELEEKGKKDTKVYKLVRESEVAIMLEEELIKGNKQMLLSKKLSLII